ncbi:MAG: hypothetical protein GWN99_00150 [Gemmatimonadetes bacterium]|uniref:Uncharacterized protein n=1 Tax=Candidatus Kutchimonas denitrificans TaxID=3056748 RepID=A0AAE5CAM7_9BACT|nr:hypothetical protein [Gemmatimonadota bacterium]NIR73518.1 hypothetical protein [Candidatus Kutchimonas denitrificans]NIR99477.1 hypothetical protein [Gemmatimonadota bacterium]NIT65097.1 hypothetical protein [Gemmatimonadota bacterium]NIV23630.1 hypothetical protein [Gemmatimonadota bacterium]
MGRAPGSVPPWGLWRVQRESSEDDKVRDLIKDISIGGLRLESVGLAWLLLGVVLSGWPLWW